ncbi:TPA: hypothetical protein KOP46_000329 [Clostridioides difficile]|nr:hypothetical protein [Clostridioides difficile]
MIDRNTVEFMIRYTKWHADCGGDAPSEWWDEFPKMFTKNLEETIKFLGDCNEEEIYWLSEIFEEISSGLQSKEFIDFIKRLQKKFPNIDMELSIHWAEQAIQED